MVGLPNVRSVALDSAEVKGNATERTEMTRTRRSGVTRPRWDSRVAGMSRGGTKPFGAIKDSKGNFGLEPVDAKSWFTPNE
jgi:hypothetical protein